MSSVVLQVLNAPIVNASERLLSRLSLPNPLYQDVPNPPTQYYTCDFRNNKLQRYENRDPAAALTAPEGT